MDSIILNKKMYLMDGSFISGVQPYILDFDSVIKHPLWGSNLLFENEEAIIRGQKDYIRGNICEINPLYYICFNLFCLQIACI